MPRGTPYVRGSRPTRKPTSRPSCCCPAASWPTALLDELRGRLGPVAFFFLSAQPEVAGSLGVAPLQPAISAGADRQAYDDWRLGRRPGRLRPRTMRR
ncbi:MAG: hypothetical protein HZY76_07640 [Anaerolineae bacterium]|nr:MAG: hypothetical protein HZY76_07640 [Anaerolineae bacterium]